LRKSGSPKIPTAKLLAFAFSQTDFRKRSIIYSTVVQSDLFKLLSVLVAGDASATGLKMSLRTFIERPEVRSHLSSFIKVTPTPGFVPPPLLAPARSAEYRLVGASFDYLMRTLVERMNPACLRKPWIASAALIFFRQDLEEIDGKLFALARECHDRALAAHKQYLSDGVLTDELLLGAIHLARIDRVYRDGPEYLRKEWFTASYPREMADLRRLYEIVPQLLLYYLS